jgi:hypothetical protein
VLTVYAPDARQLPPRAAPVNPALCRSLPTVPHSPFRRADRRRKRCRPHTDTPTQVDGACEEAGWNASMRTLRPWWMRWRRRRRKRWISTAIRMAASSPSARPAGPPTSEARPLRGLAGHAPSLRRGTTLSSSSTFRDHRAQDGHQLVALRQFWIEISSAPQGCSRIRCE